MCLLENAPLQALVVECEIIFAPYSYQELYLGDSDIDVLTVDDTGLAALPSLKMLRVLSLRRCRWIGDASYVMLSHCARLERLDVSHTDVSGRGLRWLAGLSGLKSLDCSDCRSGSGSSLLLCYGVYVPVSLWLLDAMHMHRPGVNLQRQMGFAKWPLSGRVQ